MVADPGAENGAGRVRALNRPRPIAVEADAAAVPRAVTDRGRRRRVVGVQDRWQIDDEWWREPISRRYFQLELDDGALLTLYQDAVDGRWYAQAY